jgi:hypothetical protein
MAGYNNDGPYLITEASLTEQRGLNVEQLTRELILGG